MTREEVMNRVKEIETGTTTTRVAPAAPPKPVARKLTRAQVIEKQIRHANRTDIAWRKCLAILMDAHRDESKHKFHLSPAEIKDWQRHYVAAGHAIEERERLICLALSKRNDLFRVARTLGDKAAEEWTKDAALESLSREANRFRLSNPDVTMFDWLLWNIKQADRLAPAT